MSPTCTYPGRFDLCGEDAKAGPSHSAPRLRRKIGAVLARVLLSSLAAGFLCALLVRLSPGFGLDESMLDPQTSRETADSLRHTYDGQRNPVQFYAEWIRRGAAGDLGFSHSLGRPVGQLLAERAPV